MKTTLVLTGIIGLTLLAMAAPHTWVLQNGTTFEGDYYSSGTEKVVVRKDGTNYFFKISELSEDDRAYTAEMRAKQKQARLDAEAEQMKRQGMIEFTTQLINNFPEKVHQKNGWMDAEFIELDPSANPIGDSETPGELFASITLVLRVRDNNQDYFSHCVVPKKLHGDNYFKNHDLSDSRPNPLADVVAKLRRYDKIRLVGKVSAPGTGYTSFSIEKIEVIESAAEKKAGE